MFFRVLLTILVMAPTALWTASHGLAQEASPAQQMIVRVDGASCPFCAFGLEKKLGQIDGVASVTMDLKGGKATVVLKKGAKVSEQVLRQAVEEAGFTPREIISPTNP